MTTSLPVIEYARDMGASEEQLIRALVVADLVTIHQKTSIGRLSAFCGAVSAGCGAAAGIAYLKGGDYEVVAHTIVNALAICSGMICDGAKPSCAAKIAAAVDAGLMGYHMYMHGKRQFLDGEGIIKKGVENTIGNVGRLAREGMRRTDEEILNIMVGQ
jgi:L-cysteine desulfidase